MRSQGREAITGASECIFEAEGLADAVNVVALVLSGNGKDKYPHKNWMRVSHEEHAHKCAGHIRRAGATDDDSGLPHEAHAAARALMALAHALRGAT